MPPLLPGAVRRKILADLLGRRLSSLLVALTILAAAALLTLTVTTLQTMDASFTRSFEELRGAHLWLYFDRSLTSTSDIRRIQALPAAVENTGLQVSREARLRASEMSAWVSARAVGEAPPTVNRLRITAGHALSAQQADAGQKEVLVDKRLAAQLHLQPGDTLWLEVDGRETALSVAGLAYNPTWDIYRTQQPPYIYILDSTFRRIFPDETTWDWSIGLRLSDPTAVETTLAAAELAASRQAILHHTDWQDVRDAALFNTQLTTALLMAFGLFALGAAALILSNSISGAVLAQFRDIGVLKALGFTGANIAAVYLGQNLALGALGGLAGIAAGLALAPLPLEALTRALDAPPQVVFSPLHLVLTWLAVQLVILAATFFPAWKGARTNTLQAIVSGSELPATRPSRLAHLALWLRLPIPVVLGAKQAFARRGRAAMTIFSLGLGVIALVFSALLNGVLDSYLRDPSLAGVVHDASAARAPAGMNSLSDRTARRILSQAPGVRAVLAHTLTQARTPDGFEFNLHAEEGSFEAFPFRIEAGRRIDPQASGEIMIGVGLQRQLGLIPGDRLVLTINERRETVEWVVVGIYREPSDNGQMAVVSLSTLRTADRQAAPTGYLLKLLPAADISALRAYLQAETGDHLTLSVVDTEVSSLVQFRTALWGLSVVLSGIALLSVLNSAVMTTRENVSEIGIYKTLGMTPAQVTTQVLTSGALLGALAGLLGVPSGLLLAQTLLSALGSSLGFGSFDLHPTWSSLALPPLIAILVGLAGSTLPARWAAGQKVVEILMYE